jgi:hypothetical protein
MGAPSRPAAADGEAPSPAASPGGTEGGALRRGRRHDRERPRDDNRRNREEMGHGYQLHRPPASPSLPPRSIHARIGRQCPYLAVRDRAAGSAGNALMVPLVLGFLAGVVMWLRGLRVPSLAALQSQLSTNQVHA